MDEPLSLADVQGFVGIRYGDRADELEPLGAGEWSRAFAFTLDGRATVVRFGGYPEDFAKDQLMAGFSRPSLPIPRLIECGEAPRGYFAVSERAFGVPLDELDEAGMRAALPALLTAMDAIRAIDIPAGSGYGVWEPHRTGPHRSWPEALVAVADETDRLSGWREALAASATGAGPFGIGYATLRSLVAGLPDERRMVHGDLLNRNVLVQEAGISAVLDWGNALYGDWLYDAAWLMYWWPWYRGWVNIDIRAELGRHWQASVGGIPDLDLRLRCYQLHIGLAAMAYDAFTGRHDNVAWNARRTLSFV
jgi:hygromycin-B 4-O-kinase